jgi:predicted transcriptional regulator
VATTTIATMLTLMRDKGLVDRADGPRGYAWSARITRKAARAGLISRLVDLAFEGSALSTAG